MTDQTSEVLQRVDEWEADYREYFRDPTYEGTRSKAYLLLGKLPLILESLRTALKDTEWQPIETAPKDGASILGYRFAGQLYAARQDVVPIHWSKWGGGTWDNATSGHHIPDGAITHWMPLPKPPVESPTTGAEK